MNNPAISLATEALLAGYLGLPQAPLASNPHSLAYRIDFGTASDLSTAWDLSVEEARRGQAESQGGATFAIPGQHLGPDNQSNHLGVQLNELFHHVDTACPPSLPGREFRAENEVRDECEIPTIRFPISAAQPQNIASPQSRYDEVPDHDWMRSRILGGAADGNIPSDHLRGPLHGAWQDPRQNNEVPQVIGAVSNAVYGYPTGGEEPSNADESRYDAPNPTAATRS